jgi:Uma2 family endonuclease
MTAWARHLATYADLLALPETERAEVINGDLVVAPSPTPLHQATIAFVFAELHGPFQKGKGGPGGWWLIPDVDVSFGPHDVLRPDISGWRRERVSAFPRERPITVRPDGVCGGLSPRTASLDQGEKRAVYQRSGVPWYWIVDPNHRTLGVYRLAADGYVLDASVGDAGVAHLAP